MLEHGGRLLRAARRYGIEPAHWLDLSTGIAPFAWPVPTIPASAWHRLPEDDDGLIEVARDYYAVTHLLPVAGSQAAIQALPRMRAPCRVGVIAPGYAEHAHAWRSAGSRATAPLVVALALVFVVGAVDAFAAVQLYRVGNAGSAIADPDRDLTDEQFRPSHSPRATPSPLAPGHSRSPWTSIPGRGSRSTRS